MKAVAVRRVVLGALAGLLLVSAGAFAAEQLGAAVTVRARLVTSSGACEASTSGPAVGVTCQHQHPVAAPLPGGPLLPDAGDVPYRRVGTIMGAGVVAQPLPVYSDGTKITSWRVVTLDNDRYVELTIAW